MTKPATAENLSSSIEIWQVADLAPAPDNARRHPPEQIARLAESIKKFGFTIPILATSEGVVIAGHGRLLAAVEAGLAEVPVIVAQDWTEEQRRAYALADNRLAEGAEWDMNKLAVAINEITADAEFDLFEIGFSEADLKAITNGTFVPVMTPFRDSGAVTAADMARAAKRQDETGGRSADQKLRDVTCPHCGGEFAVDA